MTRLGWAGPASVLALVAIMIFGLVPPEGAAQERAPAPSNPVTSLFNLRIGGYVQTNVTRDSDENTGDNPSSLRKLAVEKGSAQEDRETLRWAATRTRLFLDLRGPEMWGAKTRAYTEFDWDGVKLNENNGASSASAAHTPRLRHAYARFDWAVPYLTVGQTTLVFDSAVSSQSELEGVSSGHGDITAGSRNRAPQFILGGIFPIAVARLEIAGSVARHATDRDPAAGLNDSGARSANPALSGIVKGSIPLFGRDVILAVSNYWGEEVLTAGPPRRLHSTGFAAEAFLPLPALGVIVPDLRGTWFTAENMDRWNLGLNGLTSSSPTANPREITATGWWAEVNVEFFRDFAVGAGYGFVEDDRDWVLKIGGSAQVPRQNTGRWVFAQWKPGPVLVEFLYGTVETTRIIPTTRHDVDTRSDAYHLIVRYRF